MGESRRQYVLLALFVVALGAAGYVGYLIYPRFDLPSTLGASLLVLSVAAGVASLFSPCSFPLLVTLLAREIGHRDTGRTRRAMSFAGALAVGATTFLLLVGGGLVLGLAPAFEQVTFTSTSGIALRIGIGSLLVLLGLVQLGRIAVPFRAVAEAVRPLQQRQAELRRRHPVLGFGLFGFVYILAGFG